MRLRMFTNQISRLTTAECRATQVSLVSNYMLIEEIEWPIVYEWDVIFWFMHAGTFDPSACGYTAMFFFLRCARITHAFLFKASRRNVLWSRSSVPILQTLRTCLVPHTPCSHRPSAARQKRASSTQWESRRRLDRTALSATVVDLGPSSPSRTRASTSALNPALAVAALEIKHPDSGLQFSRTRSR